MEIIEQVIPKAVLPTGKNLSWLAKAIKKAIRNSDRASGKRCTVRNIGKRGMSAM